MDQQQLIDRIVMQRQQIQQSGAEITGVRIHPDDLQTIEAMDSGQQVLDVIEGTLFGVPYIETTEVPAGTPEFTFDSNARA